MRRLPLFFVSLLLCTLLVSAGCAWPPDVEHPELEFDHPEQWTADSDEAGEPDRTVDVEWWTTFGDRAVDAAVLTALEQNQDLRAAAARVARAAAEARIAGADLQPSLGLGLNGARQRANFVGLPFPGGGDEVISSTYENFGVSLDVTWELDLWERLRSTTRAALADFQAAGYEYEGAYLSIAGQTVKACFAVAEARQQIALAEKTVESYRRSTDIVSARYEGGVRSPLEVRLALSNLSDAGANLELRRQRLDAARRQLDLLLGRYPGARTKAPHSLPDVPPPVPAGLPAALLSRRPDLAASERRLTATLERQDAARAALYPRISLTASGGTASNELSDLLDWDFRVWSVVGNLVQPIFQGGRLRAGVYRADAQRTEALATWAAAVLKSFAEVETALTAERLLTEREIHLDSAAAHAEAAEALAVDRYRSGLEEYITVLESQRAALATRSRHLTVRRELLDNRVDLILALGGGFRVPEEETENKQTADADRREGDSTR